MPKNIELVEIRLNKVNTLVQIEFDPGFPNIEWSYQLDALLASYSIIQFLYSYNKRTAGDPQVLFC